MRYLWRNLNLADGLHMSNGIDEAWPMMNLAVDIEL